MRPLLYPILFLFLFNISSSLGAEKPNPPTFKDVCKVSTQIIISLFRDLPKAIYAKIQMKKTYKQLAKLSPTERVTIFWDGMLEEYPPGSLNKKNLVAIRS